MPIKSQQTQLYVILPGDTGSTVEAVAQVTDITGIDAPISAVDTTTLDSDHRTFIAGIAEPSAASIKLLRDPGQALQTKLHQARNAGKTLHWAIGLSDGPSVAPTKALAGEGFDQAAVARSFTYFEGFMTSFDDGAEVNGVVSSTVGIQLVDIPVRVDRV